MWRYACNVLTHRINNGLLRPAFVCIEPVAIIVLFEIFEEGEKAFREAVKFRHMCFSYL